jgi:predicted metal-dependent hydrolase
MKIIEINGLEVELQRKKIKNMYLRVLPPNGRILITAPLRMSEGEIKSFALSKMDWILTQYHKVRQREENHEIAYESGDRILLWGQEYILSVIEAVGRPHLYLENSTLKLYIRRESTKEQRKQVIDAWYRELLAAKIPPIMAKWESIIGVTSSGFSIRDMKTRWGTCNIRTKKICFNLRLVKKMPKCLEYVVVHELVHLLEKSHNHVFKGYMDHFLPEWRRIRKELNEG